MSLCVRPRSMTTQWLALSLIEPIHRTSHGGFNTRPHDVLYLLYIHVTTTIYRYLKLSLCPFLCLRLPRPPDPDSILTPSFALCPSPLSVHLSPPSCVRLFSFRHHGFISFSPSTNPLESVHLILKLTRQTSTAAGERDVSIDKTHSMPSHTHMRARTHTHTQWHVYLHTRGRPTDS